MEFSQAELDIISQNPIEYDLDSTRRRILNKPLDEDLAERLVYDVAGLAVARKLKLSMNRDFRKSHSSASETLHDALSKVHDSLPTGAVRLEMLITVAEAVRLDKPDVEIVSTAMTLVSELVSDGRIELKQATMSVATDGVPALISADSVPVVELVRLQAEKRLLNELWFSSHRNVAGFIKKYLDTASRDPVRLAKKMKIHKNLLTLPIDTKQDSIQQWLDRAWIVGSRYRLRNTNSQIEFNEPSTQLNTVFLEDGETGETHMDNVVVIGELRESVQDFKTVFLQLARYIHSLFGAQPNRRFVHAFTLQGTTMELWVFDRSGAYSSELIDFKTELDTFAGALAFYATMSREEAGYEPEIVPLSVQPPPQSLSDHLQSSIGSVELQRPGCAYTIKVFLLDRLHVHKSIVSRATVAHKALGMLGNGDCTEGVVKFAWISTTDKKDPNMEAELLQQARGVHEVCQLEGSKNIVSTAELREGLRFSDKSAHFLSSSESEQTLSEIDFVVARNNRNGWFDERTLVCVFTSPYGSSVDTCRTPRDMVTVIRDGIVGHRALCENLILHRDISSGNLLYSFEESGIRGFLIDLDHAKALKPNWKTGISPLGEQKTRHLTGTVMFMSLGVLNGHDHTFRHDVESFWWLLLYLLLYKSKALYTGQNSKKAATIAGILTEWEMARSQSHMADYKEMYTRRKRLQKLWGSLHPSWRLEWIEELCFSLKSALFGDSEDAYIETPGNPDFFYDQILFNKALDDASR